MRDRLIELICEGMAENCGGDCVEPRGSYCPKCHNIAGHILEDGWMRLPCNVGDTVYFLGGLYNRLIKVAIVEEIILNSNGVSDLLVTSENGITFENSIDTFYFSKEAAENALKERERG